MRQSRFREEVIVRLLRMVRPGYHQPRGPMNEGTPRPLSHRDVRDLDASQLEL